MTEIDLKKLREVAEDYAENHGKRTTESLRVNIAFRQAFGGAGAIALIDEIERLRTITDAQVQATADSITIPRPVVPHGPKGVAENTATADYLREVLRKIDTGFITVGGSNVTACIRSLLIDSARALEALEAAREVEG